MGEENKTVYDKRKIAKQIVCLLENVELRDWEKIKNLIDSRYTMINQKSNFNCDKVTLNRIDNWF